MARQPPASSPAPRRSSLVPIVGALVLLGALTLARTLPRKLHPRRRPAAAALERLIDIGPRLLSDQTSTPLAISGEALRAGTQLQLGPPVDRTLPLAVLDSRHAYARLPAQGDLKLSGPETELVARLRGPSGDLLAGEVRLTLVDDAHFPDPTELVGDATGENLFALSKTTDELIWAKATGEVQRVALGDGPSAAVRDGDALLVAYAYLPEIWRLSLADPQAPAQRFPAPKGVSALAIDEARGRLFLAEQISGSVVALDLRAAGRQLWRTPVDPDPARLALLKDGESLAVGSRATGEVEILDAATGARRTAIAPRPGTPIVGGPTAPFSERILGGTAVRDLVYSPRLQRLFVASIGPDIGPNPERMEVSMNGGVAVIDPAREAVVLHRGFGAGVTQALALDDRRGLLYAADLALGQIRILDARRLTMGPAGAEAALLQTLAIPPPADFPLFRPREDFGTRGRAGVEVHSGPVALWLAPNGETLFALDRFTGTLAQIDVGQAPQGRAQLRSQRALFSTLTQPQRRMGEILYFADLGRSGMSCDACHVEGHTGGLLFAKTHPLRLYRSPSLRGCRDTPPYFIPASTFTLEQTARVVGDRNRYQNPTLTQPEIEALALYTSEIADLPNPYAAADGSLPAALSLPDGTRGNPHAGLKIFEGKAACASCHPAPLFTLDQAPRTRGRYLAVGTPELFPWHTEWQDRSRPGMEIPSLAGGWDVFPMLSSGTAGFDLKDGQLQVATRFPLRAVLDHEGPSPHGKTATLSEQEKNDLLAYLLTL